MNKKAQSLLDFINFLPFESLHIRRSPVSNREAKTLYDVFKAERDEHGKVIVPDTIDNLAIAALTTKGLLRSGFSGMRRLVEFTDKGKEIVRNIILFSEQSSFDKQSGELNYDSIFRKANNTETQDGSKIACKVKQQSVSSWLTKVRSWS